MKRLDGNDPNAGLDRQALKRPLTDVENRLAAYLEQVFKGGVHDFNQVVALLQQSAVQIPSGAPGPWSLELLERELRAINASLDKAYASGGAG